MTSHYREPPKKKPAQAQEEQVMSEQIVVEKLGEGTYYPLCKATDRSMLLIFYSVLATCVTA